MFSRILCCAFGRILQHPGFQRSLGRTELQGSSKPRKATEIMMLSTESRPNSSGTFSQDSSTLQLCGKINDLLSDLGQTPETFTGRILFMSMFNDISCDRKDNKDECLERMPEYVKTYLRERLGVGQRSFIGPGSQKKWYSAENSPQGAWDNIAEQMLLEFAESGLPTFRATTPLSRGNTQEQRTMENCQYTSLQMKITIETVFRIIISVTQLSVYGAVAAVCEEFENHQDGIGCNLRF